MNHPITECPACKTYIGQYDSLRQEYLPVDSCLECGWQRSESKQWGGPGRGQGKKSTWQTGPTKPIKVPVALADEIMHYARALDRGELPGRSPSPWSQLGDVLSKLSTPPLEPADAPSLEPEKLSEAIALLGEALTLKPNAGGAIKVKIRKALEVLNV